MEKKEVERAIEGIKAIEGLLSVFKESQWTQEQEEDAKAMLSLIVAARDFLAENRDEIRRYVIYGDAALVDLKSIDLNSQKMIEVLGGDKNANKERERLKLKIGKA